MKVTVRLLWQLASISFIPFTLTSADEGQIVLEPGFDGTLNHIQYTSGFVEPTSERHVAAKKRALEQIAKPDEDGDEEWTVDHPRWRLLQALHSYSRYKTRYVKQLNNFRQSFDDLPDAMRKVVKASTKYAENFEKTRDLWDINGALSEQIVQHGLEWYNISREELETHITLAEAEEQWDNQAAVADAVNHYVRDWATDGLHERIPTYDPIIKAIEHHFPDRANRKDGPVTILTPGQGLGRLPHALSNLGDVDVTSNEYSYYMLLAYRFAETLTIPGSIPFHPFIDWWSYQLSAEERMREVRIPDASVNASAVVLREGDFMYEFDHETGRYDVVVTLFFIDTAKNALDYIDNINRLLKPGGLWINLGPLLYGTNPIMQLSLSELVGVSEEMGFEFLETEKGWFKSNTEYAGGAEYTVPGKVRGFEINYLVNKRSIRRNVYQAQFWVAKKVHRNYPAFPALGHDYKSSTKEHTFDG